MTARSRLLACQRLPYHYLRLLPESPAQINIVAGAKQWEIEELLIATMDIGDKGGPSDYYMSKNRKAAREAARIAAEQQLTLAEVYRQLANSDYWQEEAPGFLDKLSELANVAAINAKTGVFSLAEIVQSGGAVYVVGSMTLAAVLRAQQMLFVRIQQLATARDRLAGAQRTVCVIADEMRYHISKPVIQGLAASRDKGMRVILAFQSFADLKDCPSSMTPEMVEGAIIENTRAKLIYRVEDPDTAEWLQRKSGIILVDDEAKVINRNVALAETTEGERTIRQSDHFLFDTNRLTNLPPGWGVLFGQNLAQACYVSPIPTKKCRSAVTPVAAADQLDESSALVEFPRTSLAIPQTLAKSINNDFFTLE
ncbi:MAG: type IV secretion system DNA-binding domain-containing protein [Ferribacterium limneticum]